MSGSVVLVDGHAIGSQFVDDLHLAFDIDPLSGCFLAMLGLAGIPKVIYGSTSKRDTPHTPRDPM